MDRERVALYAGTIAAYSDMYVTQSILPLLSKEFGIGPARAGLTVSAVVLTIAVVSPLYGPLSDALGRRRVMVGSTALLSLATLACAFAPSFGALVTLRAVQGLFVPGMSAVSVAYVGDRYEQSGLPTVVAGIIAAGVLGGLLGRVLAGAVAAVGGWRASFMVFAALTALAALLLARGLAKTEGGRRAGVGEAWTGMVGHLRDPRLVGAYVVGGALFFAFIGIFTYLPFRLSAPPYALPPALVSSVYVVYVAGTLSSRAAGRLSGRIPPRTLIAVGLAVEALGMALTAARPLALVVLGLVVLVVGTFTAQAIAPAFVNATAVSAKGGASALYLASYYVGGTLGSALPGLAWQAAGWNGVILCCLAATAVAMAANALLCGRVPSRRGPG